MGAGRREAEGVFTFFQRKINLKKYTNMAKKIITAADVLAKKGAASGYKFDTNGLINEVARFFLDVGETWDKTYIVPCNFQKYQEAIDKLDITSGWFSAFNYKEADKYLNIIFDDYLNGMKIPDFKPYGIHVDEQYIKPALIAVEIMGGYVVKYDKKAKAYAVTLT